MSLRTLIKRPGESILFTFDFTALLNSGETISSVSSVTQINPNSPDAADLTLGSPTDNDAAYAQCRISGGTDGYTYPVICTVTTSASNTRQDWVQIKVEASPTPGTGSSPG